MIDMEACATAHHCARKSMALGHEVRLMRPHYVNAYLKRNKNDAADARAICEAVKRPTMVCSHVSLQESEHMDASDRTFICAKFLQPGSHPNIGHLSLVF
jgi:transposase